MLLCPCLLLISLSCQVLSCIFHLNSFRLGSLGVAQMGKFWFWWRPAKQKSHIKPSCMSIFFPPGPHYTAVTFFTYPPPKKRVIILLPLIWSKPFYFFVKQFSEESVFFLPFIYFEWDSRCKFANTAFISLHKQIQEAVWCLLVMSSSKERNLTLKYVFGQHYGKVFSAST